MCTCYSAIGSDLPGSASVTASQFLLFLLLERVDSEIILCGGPFFAYT